VDFGKGGIYLALIVRRATPLYLHPTKRQPNFDFEILVGGHVGTVPVYRSEIIEVVTRKRRREADEKNL
jgi:hypothetical protein